MVVTGTGSDFMIMGPLRGGGILVEVGWTLDSGAGLVCRQAMALTGSPSPTIGNLRGGTSLITRSNDVSGAFGVPTITTEMTSIEHFHMALPMSVRLDAGGQYIIMGIHVVTAEQRLHTVAWALEVERSPLAPGPGGMVDAGGFGVENGLER